MEVLFSVMILGIGMIMVAAMFPAAIKQTQANVEDGSSASIAQLADNTMQLYANSKDVPLGTPPVDTLDRLTYTDTAGGDNSAQGGPPIIYSFHDPRLTATAPTTATELWQLISPNLVSPNDPQYAWVPLFSRAKLPANATANTGPHPTLGKSFQLFLIPVRCRNRSSGYLGSPNGTPNTASDTAIDTAGDPANLEPALINVNLIIPAASTGNAPYLQVAGVYYGSGWGQTAWYADTGNGGTFPLDSNPQFNPVASGAYIVISDAGPGAGANAIYNGAIFKVGTQVQQGGLGVGTTGEFWSIAPDFNGYSTAQLVTNNPGGTTIALNKALVVGRQPDVGNSAFSVSSSAPIARAGVAQDMGIFLTVVALP